MLKLMIVVKQQLDIEVNRTLARCQSDKLMVAVENPKVLANLRDGSLARWARCYYANRLTVRAREEIIPVLYVSPAYTSVTCSFCQKVDKCSRVNRDMFECTGCGSSVHADVNAGRNIARKGRESLIRKKNGALNLPKDSSNVVKIMEN